MGGIKLKINTRDRDEKNTPRILEITKFEDIDISLKFDSVASTFKFRMLFDSNDPLYAELLAPSHMHECSIYYVHDQPGTYMDIRETGFGKQRRFKRVFRFTTDELIITGFALSTVFKSSAKPQYVEVGGYSKPGLLGDCDIPTSAYPLQSDGLSFRQIVNKILPYFSNSFRGGFSFEIKSSRADSVFESASDGEVSIKSLLAQATSDADEDLGKTTAPESKNVLSYLKELGIQKNLTMGCDRAGNLIVDIAYTGKDYLFTIGTGSKPIRAREITCTYNGQEMHSQIELVGQPDKVDPKNFPYAIVHNPLCKIVFRPKVVTMSSGTDNTIKQAAESELGAELKNIPLVILLDSPIANGKFITPNNMIQILHRDCYLYRPSEWFIEEMHYVKNSKSEDCTVTAVLPGVYNGRASSQKDPFLDHHENFPKVV